jgi:hypothetical protein
MKVSLQTIILCCLLVIKAHAQQNTVACGGQAIGAGGTVSYSIGQIDYINTNSSSGTITQGVQQPYEILQYTGIEETNISLSVTAFPNPTSTNVKILIKNNTLLNFTYTLCNVQGQVIINENIKDVETIVPMMELASGIYVIRIVNNNKEVSTYKIIKN